MPARLAFAARAETFTLLTTTNQRSNLLTDRDCQYNLEKKIRACRGALKYEWPSFCGCHWREKCREIDNLEYAFWRYGEDRQESAEAQSVCDGLC